MAYKNFSLRQCDETLFRLMPTLPPGSAFFQKWTCGGCGARVMGETPNKLFAAGHCQECDHTTDLREAGCNYSIHMAIGGINAMPVKGSA